MKKLLLICITLSLVLFFVVMASAADKAENELSLQEGFRLLSSYRDRNQIKFWIITEADRSTTTVLLPDDY